MIRGPFVVAALSMAAALAWAIRLAVSPEPFAPGSALLVSSGMLGFGLITTTGMLLTRGRWARNVALGLTGLELVTAALVDLDAGAVVAIGLTGAAIVGLAGPWPAGWLRRRPAAGAPGPKPLALTIGALAIIPALGLAAPSGIDSGHLVLGGLAAAAAWAYARSLSWGLWGLRAVLPVAAAPAVVATPLPGSVGLALLIAAVAALAWTRQARLAVDPVFVNPPGPRIATPGKGAP